jgi:hypothetical protein
VALVAVIGTLAYVGARDEVEPATTTTSTSVPPTDEEVAHAITDALAVGLDVPLAAAEARCVADGLLTVLGQPRLEAMAEAAGGVDDLSDAERTELVRTMVLCLPEEKAAALLGTPTTMTTVAQLPDEDL